MRGLGDAESIMKATIKSVQAVRGVVDRLYWSVEVEAPGWGQKNYILADWEGEVVFHRQPVTASTWAQVSPAQPGLPLTARWMVQGGKVRVGFGQKVEVLFMSELPGDGLARVEDFREGGRLYACLEGEFMVFLSGAYVDFRMGERRVADDTLAQQFSWNGGQVRDQVACSGWELPRDTWNNEVLAKLRPEDRVILELSIPTTGERGEHARAAMKKLDQAQKAFDEGRYTDVPMLVYVASEFIMNGGSAELEPRYGEQLSKRIKGHMTKFNGVCNRERHGNEPEQIDMTDRILAQHLLVVGKSLAAVYLRGGDA